MNPSATAVRAGGSRGLIELRQSVTNGGCELRTVECP